jgi:hypothetical protein
MDARTRSDQLREASNPLFNDRKLKLGTFCTNLSGGCTMSSIDGILQAKWESTEALARMADGSYGICMHCEEEIKPKRLDAVPWTKYCIRCQEAADRHEFEAEAGETLNELLANAA